MWFSEALQAKSHAEKLFMLEGLLEPAIGTSSCLLRPGERDLLDGVRGEGVWGGDDWGLGSVPILVGHKANLHDASVVQRVPERENHNV